MTELSFYARFYVENICNYTRFLISIIIILIERFPFSNLIYFLHWAWFGKSLWCSRAALTLQSVNIEQPSSSSDSSPMVVLQSSAMGREDTTKHGALFSRVTTTVIRQDNARCACYKWYLNVSLGTWYGNDACSLASISVSVCCHCRRSRVMSRSLRVVPTGTASSSSRVPYIIANSSFILSIHYHTY